MDSPPSSRAFPAASPPGTPAVTVVALLLAMAATSLPEPVQGPPPPIPALAAGPTPLGALPELLSQTGLSDGQALEYSPQYPLWSDGAAKRRWVALPPGTFIDGRHPDDWQIPVGTRFWKELSFGDKVETRYLEKLPDGRFRYASYVWDRDQRDARLAPDGGVRDVHALAPGKAHDVPSRSDCRVCHEGRPSSVLGFNALQLSPDRDPLAAHAETPPPDAVDLRGLVQRGLLRHFPAQLLETPPRIAARTALERAARGYLVGNCAGCHNRTGPLADVGLDLDYAVSAPARALPENEPSRFRIPGEHASVRLRPGAPARSSLWYRMSQRDGATQMPPLGTELVDPAGTELIARFIASSSRHVGN